MSDGELWVYSEDNADEVGLECADHALGDVAAMHVRRYFLVLAFPFDSDVGNVRGTCFVVEDLEVDEDPLLILVDDTLIGKQPREGAQRVSFPFSL